MFDRILNTFLTVEILKYRGHKSGYKRTGALMFEHGTVSGKKISELVS